MIRNYDMNTTLKYSPVKINFKKLPWETMFGIEY